ncbi:hypothetical protein [Empedobacter brevis]|uniref:hypothetical protein n=1 Tax=Empedobacter brevis TaxID=247 RepID=UPI0028B0EBC8|nr:hypothetical protein [Empedobacter brevis]
MIKKLLAELSGNKVTMVMNYQTYDIKMELIEKISDKIVSVKFTENEYFIKDVFEIHEFHLKRDKIKIEEGSDNTVKFNYFDDKQKINYKITLTIYNDFLLDVKHLIKLLKSNNPNISNQRSKVSIQLDTERYQCLEDKFGLSNINFIEKDELIKKLENLLDYLNTTSTTI